LTNENFDTLRPNGRLQYVTDLLDMNADVATVPDSTLKTEFLRRSVEYLTRTVSIYPTHSSAWLLLGNASYKLHKDPKEALADYEKAADYEAGGSYDIWYNIGCVEKENNMPAQARDHFIKALNLKPDKIDATINLGEVYMNLNMPDSAMYWFRRSLELNPHDGLTYYKMGTLYGKQLNNLDMAAQYISKAIEYDPNVVAYYEDLGVVYGLKNQPDDAIRVSEECLKRFPNYLPALRNIAISYYKKGDMQKAHEYDAKLGQLTGQNNGGIFK
jgi:tetratricopeptide (TPR) repeat protein